MVRAIVYDVRASDTVRDGNMSDYSSPFRPASTIVKDESAIGQHRLGSRDGKLIVLPW